MSIAGKGAFGVVKLAITKKGGDHFAVKSISKAKLVCKEASRSNKLATPAAAPSAHACACAQDVKDVQAEVAIMNLVRLAANAHCARTHPGSCCLPSR
jgi:calcium-dependent protein kinase